LREKIDKKESQNKIVKNNSKTNDRRAKEIKKEKKNVCKTE
jgi:hypothetical protein